MQNTYSHAYIGHGFYHSSIKEYKLYGVCP